MSEFWLTKSDTNGVWTLMWNKVGTAQDNSVPVMLKTTAQVTTRKKKIQVVRMTTVLLETNDIRLGREQVWIGGTGAGVGLLIFSSFYCFTFPTYSTRFCCSRILYVEHRHRYWAFVSVSVALGKKAQPCSLAPFWDSFIYFVKRSPPTCLPMCLGLQKLVIATAAAKPSVPATLPAAVGQHRLVVHGARIDVHSARFECLGDAEAPQQVLCKDGRGEADPAERPTESRMATARTPRMKGALHGATARTTP